MSQSTTWKMVCTHPDIENANATHQSLSKHGHNVTKVIKKGHGGNTRYHVFRENRIETKTWQTVGRYSNYEEANTQREVLLLMGGPVKVKRCGPGGTQFAVKIPK